MSDQIFPQETIDKLKEAYQCQATHMEAIYHSGVSEELHREWYKNGGREMIERWMIEKSWSKKWKGGKAEKLFLEPSNHKEAEAVVKRHPLLKKEYSERTEHTGADGKDLIPVPLFDVFNNNSNKQNQELNKADQNNSGGDIGQQDSVDNLIPDSYGSVG